MSVIVKAGKKVKSLLKSVGFFEGEQRVTFVRRIERIHTDKRICALTFDDGPMNIPPSPDMQNGRSMTDLLLDTLGKYYSHATFDIIGCTADNYPDSCGKNGTPSWGGKKYDHYPDINKDMFGGALNCPRLVKRMIEEGHELANHGYRHIIFGKKSMIYGARKHFNTLDEVTDDLECLHRYIKNEFDYEIKLSRPPHYVDRINKKFTSYDAYSLMGYEYMAASYDGGGWLPSSIADTTQAQNDEVEAMISAISKPLSENPNFFCGQIIFGKDGYNMAKRTPVAYALDKQLEHLYKNGYKVVTVSELMEESPFADAGRECDILDGISELAKTHAVAYSDNTLRLKNKITNYEYAMLVCPKTVVVNERIEKIKSDGQYVSEYDTALEYAKEHGYIDSTVSGKAILTRLSDGTVSKQGFTRYEVLKKYVNENFDILEYESE